MKRRLILHLGLSKTGTTSIQAFFRQNPDTLAEAGIVYPKPGTPRPGHPWFQPTLLKPNPGRERNHAALAEEIRRRRVDAADASIDTTLWSAAFQQIDESGAHTAIISYENFYRRTELYRFDVLASRMSAFDVWGVVYLRPQEDWAISLYGQSVRGRARLTTPFARFAASLRGHLTYSAVLDKIRDHIPLDRLVVGNFHEAAMSGLVEDFLGRTELPRDQLVSAPQHEVRNSSLPPWAVLFLLRCNRAALADEAFIDVRRALTVGASRGEAPALSPGLEVATPDERQALRDTAAADADRLAERFGVTLNAKAREPAAYRPFDDDDFAIVREAVAPRVSALTRDAIGKM